GPVGGGGALGCQKKHFSLSRRQGLVAIRQGRRSPPLENFPLSMSLGDCKPVCPRHIEHISRSPGADDIAAQNDHGLLCERLGERFFECLRPLPVLPPEPCG